METKKYDTPRRVNLPGVCNMRDLGGLKTIQGDLVVKSNRLLRSDEPSRLTEKEWEYLYTTKNIHYICDLRRKDQQLLFPVVLPESFKQNILYSTWDFEASSLETMKYLTEKIRGAMQPLIGMDDEQLKKWVEMGKEGYYRTGEMCQIHYRGIFDIILKATAKEEGVLFFCGAGQDRTGFAAAYLLKILGVSDSEILDDYVLTANAYLETPPDMEYLKPLFVQNGLDELPARVVLALTIAHREILERAFEIITELGQGSALTYITELLQLKENEITLLNQSLLEPVKQE